MFPEIMVQTWPVLAMKVRVYAVVENQVKLLIQQQHHHRRHHHHHHQQQQQQ